jgi:hypothetical protein
MRRVTIFQYHHHYITQIFGSLKVGTIEQYFPVFDKLRKEFLVGELIWNFADFMTQQGLSVHSVTTYAFVLFIVQNSAS